MPVFQLSEEIIFPSPELARKDGLLAFGGDLSEERLITAYSMGIFPGTMKALQSSGGLLILVSY